VDFPSKWNGLCVSDTKWIENYEEIEKKYFFIAILSYVVICFCYVEILKATVSIYMSRSSVVNY